MPRYLVSGTSPLASDVVAVMQEHGAEATPVEDIADVPRVCTEAGADAFDGYVQLPASFDMQGDTAVARVHHFFADGVLARFSAVAAALPALRPDARLTFVLGVLPSEVSTEDDVTARASLVRILGHAARADAAGPLRLAVLESDSTAKDIALAALGRGTDRPAVDELSEESFAEWRMELLGMVWAQT